MKRLLIAVLWMLAGTAGAVSIPGGGGQVPCSDSAPAANLICARNGANTAWVLTTNASGGAPTNAGYWTSAADATLSSEQNLGGLTTGFVINTAGVPSAYNGSTPCATGHVKTISATGATTCTQVDLTTDVTDVLPIANGGFGAGATPIDNGVPVGNSTTAWQTKVIPNCASPISSKLIYDATSHAFGCGVDQNNSAGLGDVVGPAGAFPGGLAFWDGPTGKLLTTADRLGGLIPGTQYAPLVDSTGQAILSALSGTGSLVANNTPILLTPFILGFDFANHGHTTSADGGKLDLNAANNGSILSVANGGTGTTTSTGTGSVVRSDSPQFTGTPATTTPANNDNSTRIATSAFVQTEVHETGGITDTEINNLIAPGSCANCNLSYNADGRITAAINGTGGPGGGITQVGDCSTATSPCYQTETQNKVLAAPSGSTGQVTSRLLVNADIPTGISGSKIGAGIIPTNITGAGVVPAAQLGTGGNGTNFLRSDGTFATPPGTGTVTSVAMTVPAASIFSIAGSPVTTTGSLDLTTAGTSGGIPYFSSATQLSSSAQLTGGRLVLGGGAGGAPTIAGAGTVDQLWHGNAGGAGSYGAVNLANTQVTGTLPVTNGGTGVVSPTTHTILVSRGALAMVSLPAATNGQLIIGNTGNDPNVATLLGTTAETDVTVGAGTLQVGLPNDVTISNNLSVNNLLAVANQADGSNGLDMFNNTTIMQQGSSGKCNLAFVGGRISKRCNGDTSTTAGRPYGNVFAEGTFALNITAVNTGTCGTAQTTAITGLLTTDTILWNPNAAVTAPNGLLTRNVYPTADTLNVVVCNPTAGNLTPGAMTINYKVIR